MADKTGIEWTDATWNPIRGCSRVSEGCRHCYAESVANRFSGPGQPYEGLVQLGADGKGNGKWNGTIRFVKDALLQPMRWKRPRRIFVNSMSDLFHEGVTDAMLDRIFAVMALCPQHTFQVLTKRPERMRRYMSMVLRVDGVGRLAGRAADIMGLGPSTPDWLRNYACQPGFDRSRLIPPLPNVWLGVSVEDQETADARIPLLLQTPAAKRFISAEPLLGLLNLESSLGGTRWIGGQRGHEGMTRGVHHHDDRCEAGLDWVIVGGESGPGARPMHPGWARSLRDQCLFAGVPFFFKQWGEWLPFSQRQVGQLRDSVSHDLAIFGSAGVWHTSNAAKAMNADLMDSGADGCWRVGKKAAGGLLDGVQYHQFPRLADGTAVSA